MRTPTDELAEPRELKGTYRVDWPEGEYRDYDAYGSTLVRAADRSIDAFRHELVREYDSDSMRIGSLCHLAVLEPDRFEDIAKHVQPKRPGRENWHKKHLETAYLFTEIAPEVRDFPDDWVEFVQSDGMMKVWDRVAEEGVCAGKNGPKRLEYACEDGFDELVRHFKQNGVEFDPDQKIPSATDIKQARQCRDTIMSHPKIDAGIIDGFRSETSFIWSENPRDHHIPVKGRVDMEIRFDDGTSILFDLKTRRGETNEHGIKKHISKYRSHAQAAGYKRGYEQATGRDVIGYFYLASQYDPPHHTRIFGLYDEGDDENSNRDIEKGLERYMNGLVNISKIYEDPDIYGGPSDEIITLNMEDWRL